MSIDEKKLQAFAVTILLAMKRHRCRPFEQVSWWQDRPKGSRHLTIWNMMNMRWFRREHQEREEIDMCKPDASTTNWWFMVFWTPNSGDDWIWRWYMFGLKWLQDRVAKPCFVRTRMGAHDWLNLVVIHVPIEPLLVCTDILLVH